MRRWMKVLVLAGLFAVLLCGSALAAENGMQNVTSETGYSLAPKTTDGQPVPPGMADGKTFHKDAARLDLKVSKVNADSEYLVFLLEADTTPTDSNIVYIDQKSGSEAGDGSSLVFDVYPSRLMVGKTYNAFVSSTSQGLMEAGSFVYNTTDDYKAYTLGDIVGPGSKIPDGKITVADALAALEISVGKPGYSEMQKLAANVDGVAGVKVGDALMILQRSVGKPVF